MNLIDTLNMALEAIVVIIIISYTIAGAYLLNKRKKLHQTLSELSQKFKKYKIPLGIDSHLDTTDASCSIYSDTTENKPKIADLKSSSNQSQEQQADMLDIDEINNKFKQSYDDDYEKAINVTALELSHAQSAHMEQLLIQKEKEKRARLVTG